MQARHHIDSCWYPGTNVLVSKSEISCSIDQGNPYDLVQAFEDAPHVELMNLSCDQDWKAFVTRWGPLGISGIELRRGRSKMRLDWCWAFQRRITAFSKLLGSFGKTEERARLQQFLATASEEAKHRDLGIHNATLNFHAFLTTDAFARQLAEQVGEEGSGLESLQCSWLEQADARAVHDAIGYLIQTTSFVSAPSLYVRTVGKRRVVMARLGLDNLEDSLEWMIWNGYWMKKPQLFCQECQRAFRPESAHPRKYCCNECAHRATDRAWRRKQRAKRRKLE